MPQENVCLMSEPASKSRVAVGESAWSLPGIFEAFKTAAELRIKYRGRRRFIRASPTSTHARPRREPGRIPGVKIPLSLTASTSFETAGSGVRSTHEVGLENGEIARLFTPMIWRRGGPRGEFGFVVISNRASVPRRARRNQRGDPSSSNART